MDWRTKSFSELDALELYKILQLRINVFMLEQDCLYPECDDKDLKGKHLFAMDQDTCVAYARLLPPDVSYPQCSSIGRVVVHADYRKHQYGQLLMNRAIEQIKKDYPDLPIRISAQEYLKRFYTGLGFQIESDVYLEDNIPHLEMALYP
ncbi:GNAT family N-acetyltransferase [Sphingobacterium sp.]|uniref:GNAT family N-acetyltransferase n=1 Tax=Sphingobacterium sp. TaxID=341027 RepID=UPI0028AA01FD|nr:GNAT family N-acetyltransferase [Sphingobacterium sp.]